MKIELNLTPRAADLLRTNSMKDFRIEQDGRFLPLDGAEEEHIKGGTLHWCATAADALLLRAYEQADGYEALLYSDEASAAGQRVDPYVVWTSRPWSEVWGQHRG